MRALTGGEMLQRPKSRFDSMTLVLVVFVSVLLVACGGQGEVSDEVGYLDQFEGDALVEEGEPVDLELSTGVVANNDSFAVTASVRALDETFVSAPMVRFELSEGVSVASLPHGCDVAGSVVDCNVAGFLESGSLPTPFESVDIEFTLADGAVSPIVTVTATSFRNSLEQDPDPGNNVTEIQLTS